jgi:hypothetical protein
MKFIKLTTDWLMQGDPAIRWQVMRDLISASPQEIEQERRKTLQKGWGKRLLAKQDDSGLFAGALYSPKWISTTYSLLLLRRIGIPPHTPQIQSSCKQLLENGLYHDRGINYFKSMQCSETCVTGMVLSLLSYFRYPDERVKKLVEYLVNEQLSDGGWNCEKYRGATHSSFHTTISVLEGLWEFQSTNGYLSEQIEAAQVRAVEFLLEHRLYRSHQSGEIVDSKMTRLSFPPRWRYDVLRALDYFRNSKIPYDSRMDDALKILFKKQLDDGRWPLQQNYPGRSFFEMEEVGKPSRWNTLRVLRVVKWFENNSKEEFP